ncbi:desmethyl-deoxy-podophyllotoxin synthase-like [Populus alba]|uniref:desmethyl-deoxy-podophyllotoxin synthase-like n=1 Tax=Populus alba TaxID=43335 RepID=UPI003CC799F4
MGKTEMVKHPKVTEKAQAEARQVFADVDEAESKEACKIIGFDMPAQSRVIVNIWVIGREPINWTEPERFYPERFLDRSMDYKGIDFKFIPFGAGTLFGMATVVLPLAQLLWF